MTPDVIPEQGGWLAALVTTLLATAFGVYKFLRQVKTDNRNDDRQESISEFVAKLQTTIDKQDVKIAALETRLDTMAAERNRVMVENATLVAEVKRLNIEVARLNTEMKEIEAGIGSAVIGGRRQNDPPTARGVDELGWEGARE